MSSEGLPVQEPAGVIVCRSAPTPGICDVHGVDYGECADEHEARDYATAYGSLHEVVRAFLTGERNARYLRRMHAEIESELTGGGSRG